MSLCAILTVNDKLLHLHFAKLAAAGCEGLTTVWTVELGVYKVKKTTSIQTTFPVINAWLLSDINR